ncbi:MAG: AMP-binding protein, partial [Acidobacteria bacterium]|nr:AMP-binding protein [Acidobacteriota bacterium]
MILTQLLQRAALRRPASEAVVDGARRLTFAELFQQASAVGRGFITRLGVRKGDRVLIALRNRLEHVISHWALQQIGAVPTPVNFRFSPEEMRYVLEDCSASVILFEPTTRTAAMEAVRKKPAKLVFVGDETPEGAISFRELSVDGPSQPADVAESDLALILYTSGTTGRPKGVPRTHKNQCAGALAHVIQCQYEWGERTLGVMPLYHTMGIHSLTSMAAINGCFVCQPEWSAEAALRLIAGERVTALYLIPTLFYDLVRTLESASVDVSCVRKLAYAGAPMVGRLGEKCIETFHPKVFVNHYGSTEIYTFSIRPDVSEKPGCAGRPGIHSTLRIVTASTEGLVGPDETVAQG